MNFFSGSVRLFLKLINKVLIMPRYIVTYDLVNRRDYSPLIDKIKSYRGWAHPLESVWIIITNETPSQVRDSLSEFLSGDDKLLVMKTAQGASWVGLGGAVSEWIKNNSANQ
ncbi:hypothetical protein [Enterobacter hormaechei]|uniref:hypothetical protein n=1 Tax=Enterobacter hormaechei TaxID=158836 RepID=UPI001F2F1E42|nr:hypothetical protein [Enterobacter hormaechei]